MWRCRFCRSPGPAVQGQRITDFSKNPYCCDNSYPWDCGKRTAKCMIYLFQLFIDFFELTVIMLQITYNTNLVSTVKHLSRNYASFQQPSVQEWYSLSTSGQTQNIPNGIPLTFMEMDTSCRTQDTKQKKSPSWCVMLTLKKNSCKSIF